MMAVYVINTVLALVSAVGFWLSRTIVASSLSSQFIWRFGLTLIAVLLSNTFISLFLAAYFFTQKVYILSSVEVGYCLSPFAIGVLGKTFEDRRWAIPTMVAVLISGSFLSAYLAINGI